MDEIKPSKSTLLAALYGQSYDEARLKKHPAIFYESHDFRLATNDNSTGNKAQKLLVALNRLPASWRHAPKTNETKIYQSIADIALASNKIEVSSIRDTSARHTGTVLHRILRQLVLDGINKWNKKRIMDQTPYWQSQLQGLGLTDYDQPLSLLQRSVEACIKDKNNHWIFDSTHENSKCEYRIGHRSLKEGQTKTSIIDRCFILDGIQSVSYTHLTLPTTD